MSATEDFDDFVFKPATTSNDNVNISNINNKNDSSSISSSSGSNSNSNIANKSPTVNTSPTINNSNNIGKTNMRLPALDAFITERKREMDSELNKLGKERLEEFLNREKEAEKQSEMNKIFDDIEIEEPEQKKDFEALGKQFDEMEAEMFEKMKRKAVETWKELEEEYKKTIKDLETEQTGRLIQESQLQESLKASGSVFDKQLFEKLVEKCGKGRNTPFGREKMARFWQVLDRTFPKDTENQINSKDDDDKLLVSLLGQ